MSLTFKDLKTRIRKTIWVAPGERANLKAAHDLMFVEAMIEIQKWVIGMRENNTSVIAACTTLVQCGVTVFDTVPGVIKRVYSIANDDFCDKVWYSSAEFPAIRCWSDMIVNCIGWSAPENLGLPALQQGFRYADASTDSENGRARTGMWAIDRRRINIAPWIQSNEKVVVEWDGWKIDWKDDDIIDEEIWGPDAQAAIRTFVRWKDEDLFGCDRAKKVDLYTQFYGARNEDGGELSDLMYWDKKRREGDPEAGCPQVYLPGQEQIDDDVAPTEVTSTSFAVIGDFGQVGAAQEQVASMVLGWKPDFILTTGDNWYNYGNVKADLDLLVGKLYQSYIGRYSGIYGNGASVQNFYATIGNHDRDPAARLPVSLDYFSFAAMQSIGSAGDIKPFYSVVRGPLHIFVIDAGFDSSQVNQQTKYGNTATSAQAEWLRIGLLLSTSKWKIVLFHQPPYTSFHTPGTQATLSGDGFLAYPDMRWPFKAWGADLVINGHIHWYERLEVDGFPYIANGAGGKEVVTVNGALSPYSKVLYDGDFGAQRCTVDCTTLKLEFLNRSGVVQDTFTLTK